VLCVRGLNASILLGLPTIATIPRHKKQRGVCWLAHSRLPPATWRSVQRWKLTIQFTFQNVRSLINHTTDGSNAKQDELFAHMHTHKINIALSTACGNVEIGQQGPRGRTEGEFLMLLHGLAAKACDRGQLGVAIVLDTDAQHTWIRTHIPTHAGGARTISTKFRRLHGRDRER